MNTAVASTRTINRSVRGAALLALAAASLWLVAAAPAMAEKSGASAAASAKSQATAKRPAMSLNEIPMRTAQDDQERDKERKAQLAERSASLVADAKKDMAAKRYKEALRKANSVLEFDPKNAEAADIRKKAEAAGKK